MPYTPPPGSVADATTSSKGQIQLAGDLGGSAAAPTVLAVSNVVKYGSLTVLGHSYTAGTTQTDSGTSNVYQESNIAKLQSLLGIHEHNVIHLGQAGSRITQPLNGILNHPFSGWSAAWQFILPNNNTNINASGDVVIYDPVVAINGAFVIVHGVNDFTMGVTGTAADDAQWALLNNNAGQHAYRSVFSRMRSGVVLGSSTSAGSIAWDSSIGFSGGSDVVSVTENTGSAYKSFNTNGNTFTLTIPTNFTGGTIAVNLKGQLNAACHLTGNVASSGGVTLAFTNGGLPTSGTLTLKIGSEEMVATMTSSTGATVASGDRGANGTVAAAHSTNDVMYVAQDVHKINWTTSASSGSGLFSSVTGSTFVSGQGTNGAKVSITKRFTAVGADAGQTITGTVAGLLASDTSAIVEFDSWQIEAPNPPPIVYANLPYWSYGGTLTRNEIIIPAWNTAIAAVISEFDSWIQIADVYTPFWKRAGTTTVAVPASGDSGTSSAVSATTLTDGTKGWATNALVGQTITSGGKTMVVTSNTATVLTGASWTGGTPATGSYTVTGTAASVPWTGNDSSFTPTVGMRFSFGRTTAEHVDITAVSGSFPNYVLGFKRAVGETSANSHSTNNFFAPLQWVHTDDVHLTAQGHAVFAEEMYRAFTSMPTPTRYQVGENQGNWSQGSQLPQMGIVDTNWIAPPISATAAGTVTLNRQTATPIYIPKTCIVTGMAVSPRASSSGTIRYGIYLPDQTHSRPGRLLQDFGAYSYVTTATWATTGFYQVLRPGWYWLSAAVQATAVSMNIIAGGGLDWPTLGSAVTPTGNAVLTINGYTQTGISGALADWTTYNECGTGASGALEIAVQLRAVQYA